MIGGNQTFQRQWMLTALPGTTYEELLKAKAEINLTNVNSPTAFGGCNKMFFTAKTGKTGEIDFSNIGATKMYCIDVMKVEDAIKQTLPLVRSYEIEGHKIFFKNEAGDIIIKAVAADWD